MNISVWGKEQGTLYGANDNLNRDYEFTQRCVPLITNVDTRPRNFYAQTQGSWVSGLPCRLSSFEWTLI